MDIETKKAFLKLARKTLEERLFGRSGIELDEENYSKFKEKGAVFVTLHLRDEERSLRGCIGNFDFSRTLADQVKEMAIASAFEDPRFPPLRPEELKEVEIEISVLTPPVPVKDISEIKVGRDGLLISKGWHRGVLLPQVAIEHNWDRITFLRHTCIKAGLHSDAWKEEDTLIERFEALVFSESEFGLV